MSVAAQLRRMRPPLTEPPSNCRSVPASDAGIASFCRYFLQRRIRLESCQTPSPVTFRHGRRDTQPRLILIEYAVTTTSRNGRLHGNWVRTANASVPTILQGVNSLCHGQCIKSAAGLSAAYPNLPPSSRVRVGHFSMGSASCLPRFLTLPTSGLTLHACLSAGC